MAIGVIVGGVFRQRVKLGPLILALLLFQFLLLFPLILSGIIVVILRGDERKQTIKRRTVVLYQFLIG